MDERSQSKVDSERALVRQLTDLAPMQFAVNGTFKKNLKKRQAYSVDEQVRVAKSEWRKFPIPKIRFALLSWHKRVELTEKSRGFQLEQNL